MSITTLGRLVRVPLRECWEREDTEFTPWLAMEDHINLLADTIGLDLEVVQEEASVGPFRADILCRDTSTGSLVIVENQLERTDHGHLGQTLTYAAGLDAVTVVWIASRFTEEHRAALDWLNRITHEQFRFFGIEIELWRIGGSAPAPKFNLVAKPNDWSKTVTEAAKRPTGKLTPGQQRQVDYWTSFGDFIEAHGMSFKRPKPYPSNWIGYGIGRTGASLIAVINQDEALVKIELNSRENPSWFPLLFRQRESIEQALGYPLHWEEKPGYKLSAITARRAIDGASTATWPGVHRWHLDTLTSMRDVFRPRIKALDEADWVPHDADAEAPSSTVPSST